VFVVFQGWGEVYVARAQLALNPSSFQPSANAPTAIQAAKQLSNYFSSDASGQEQVIETLQEWLASPDLAKDVTLQLMAAQVYLANGRLKDALTLVVNDADNLEKLSLCVRIYLQIDRPDLAAKCLKAMQDVDDDDTLTQLSAAWLGIYTGGEKTTEAAFLLQELLEKFGPSVVVLNSLAVCDIHQRNYAQAFQYTKQARELSIKSGGRVTAETLLNSIVCLQHLRKGAEIIDKIEAELKTNYPRHPWINKQQEMKLMFEKHAAAFAAKQ
jgi:coatomer protein complex subunit epsilon